MLIVSSLLTSWRAPPALPWPCWPGASVSSSPPSWWLRRGGCWGWPGRRTARGGRRPRGTFYRKILRQICQRLTISFPISDKLMDELVYILDFLESLNSILDLTFVDQREYVPCSCLPIKAVEVDSWAEKENPGGEVCMAWMEARVWIESLWHQC